MNQANRIGLFIVIFVLFLFPVSGGTQEKKGDGKGEGKGLKSEKGFGFVTSHAPIDIDADTAEANLKGNTFTFKGNVVAKQEDANLYANTLVITFDSNAKKLKEIMATGNVKFVQLDRRATGQKATFYQESNRLVLEGEAVLREGENVIRGERVIYYIDEERAVIEGGKKGRVNTTITPPPKQ
jgi:lipopolysaccharide export system protein LptA